MRKFIKAEKKSRADEWSFEVVQLARLETDFLVAFIRKEERAIEKLKKLVESGERLTTSINASELFKGAYMSKNVEENLKKVGGVLSRLDILDFNLAASDVYGKISSELERKGGISEVGTL